MCVRGEASWIGGAPRPLQSGDAFPGVIMMQFCSVYITLPVSKLVCVCTCVLLAPLHGSPGPPADDLHCTAKDLR